FLRPSDPHHRRAGLHRLQPRLAPGGVGGTGDAGGQPRARVRRQPGQHHGSRGPTPGQHLPRARRAQHALPRAGAGLPRLPSHADSMANPDTDLEINCRAQLSILEACRKNNPGIKVVFASTRQIYGKPKYLPVDEEHLLHPVDVNGVNKVAGEQYHILYNDVYDLRACALRLTNTFGPRMRVKDARQTFLGVWIRLLVEGKPFEVWEGPQLRDFTYVDDAVEAFLLAAASEEANGQVFNLGGDCVIS